MWRVEVQSDKLFLPLLPYCRVIFSVIDEDAILCIVVSLCVIFIYRGRMLQKISVVKVDVLLGSE